MSMGYLEDGEMPLKYSYLNQNIQSQKMLPKVSEFNEICRTCLAKGGVMEPLYGDISQDVDLFHMLESCTSLTLTKMDILPSKVCFECLGALKSAYEFRQRCKRSDTTLTAILKQSLENCVDPLKSGVDSNHAVEVIEPEVEIKVESENEEGEVSKALNDLIHDHWFTETTRQAQNSDPDYSTSDNEFKLPGFQIIPNDFSCHVCKKKLANRDSLRRHMLLHNSEKAYKCSFCEKSYSQRETMISHQLTHNKDEENVKRRTCKICAKVSTSVGNLTIHMKKHTGQKDFMCAVCGKRCFMRSDLTNHERVHSDEMPFECEVCGKKFKKNDYMRNHMRTHTREKPFECTECGSKFSWCSQLTAHKRIHTGERPYKCEDCSRTFRLFGSFKAHQKSHTGIREHFCSFCNKGFYESSKLKNHMRMHTGEKPYPCKICGKAFAQSTYRSIHMNKVHRKKRTNSVTKEESELKMNEEIEKL